MTSALAVLLASSLAFAPVRESGTARQLFDAGSIAYARGRYADATRAFEAAYTLLPDPAIAFSLAQAHRRQYFVAHDRADLDRAIELYRGYLGAVAEGRRREDAVDHLQTLEAIEARLGAAEPTEADDPPAPATELMIYAAAPHATASIDGAPAVGVPAIVGASPGSHRVVVEAPGFIAATAEATAIEGRMMPLEVALDEQPARLQLTTRAGASIRVDDREVGRAPLVAPVELASGRHVVAITAPGRVSTSRAMSFQRGQVRTISVELPRTRQRVAAWALLGTSAGLWLAGGTTMGLAFGFQRRARRIDAARGDHNIELSELQSLEDSIFHRDRLRGATIGLLSGAAATTVVGLVLLFTDRG